MNTENKNSRREFVKTSALLTGGVMTMPLFTKANFFSGADDTIKIAIIGCGGRGTGAITQALSTKQNVKLVAMADAFRDRLDDCYKELTSAEADATVKKRVDVRMRMW
jgi:predicted homoserine dehydrogenase-like protein